MSALRTHCSFTNHSCNASVLRLDPLTDPSKAVYPIEQNSCTKHCAQVPNRAEMTEAGQKVQKVQMVQGRGQKVQERLSKLDRPSLSFDHGADGAEGAEGAGKFN